MALAIDSAQYGQADQAHVDFQGNIEIIIGIDDNDWLYQTQPGSLLRTIMNVLGALKYTTHGHIIVRVEIEKRCRTCHAVKVSRMKSSFQS